MPAPKSVSAFPEVFAALKQLLKLYEKNFKVMEDTAVHYTLGGTIIYKGKARESMLMAVYSMKNYVSLHLVPVYMCPESADDISPALKKRQGKGCFTFDAVDPTLFREAAALIKKSLAACKAKRLL